MLKKLMGLVPSEPNPAARLVGPGALRRVANRPLYATPGAAMDTLAFLMGRNGLQIAADAAAYPAVEANVYGSATRRPGSSFHIERGIAVIPVDGSLVHKYSGLDPSCGMTGYDGIMRKLRDAKTDPEVRGVLLDIHSPGGEVDGCADCATMIRDVAAVKPVWAIADTMCYSAAYYLASQCTRLYLAQGAGVGSVGVVIQHADFSQNLANDGIAVTLIHAGAHKVDGNPFEPLPEDVRNDFKSECESARQVFAQAVASGRGIDIEAVLATEARCLSVEEALSIGFADGVIPSQNIVQVFLDDLTGAVSAPAFTQAKATNAAVAVPPKPHIEEDTEDMTDKPGAAAPQTPIAAATVVDVSTATASAAAEATKRFAAILDLPESKGREATAKHLAQNTAMSVDDAKAMLATIPATTPVAADALGGAMAAVAQPAVLAVSAGGQTPSATVIDYAAIYAVRQSAARGLR